MAISMLVTKDPVPTDSLLFPQVTLGLRCAGRFLLPGDKSAVSHLDRGQLVREAC
jgi:hypothetical protein